MATYKITPNEVMAAIQDKNLEAAPGRFGENSKEVFEYVIKYKGKLNKPEEYENIAIRANSDGSILRLKDVARIEFGAYSYSSLTRLNGKKGIVIGVMQLAGSNANEIQIAINKLMEKAAKDFPNGIKYNIFYSTKIALDQSIDQVKHTLIEAFILGIYCRVYLSSGFPFYIDSGYCGSGCNIGYILFHAVIRLFYQPAHTFRSCTRDWYRSR